MNVLFFFIFIFITSISISKETRFSEELDFSSLCIAEQSTGFNWEKGEWVRTNFILNKYLVKKIHQDKLSSGQLWQCLGNDGKRTEEMLPFESGKETHLITRCYEVKEFGEELALPEFCSEYYRNNGNGDLKLYEIRCSQSNMNMRTNGRFTISNTKSIGDFPWDDLEDYSDSLSISIGNCSTL